MKQSEDKKSLSEKNPVADFIFFRGIYYVTAAPHSLNAGSVIQKIKSGQQKNAKKEVSLWWSGIISSPRAKATKPHYRK